jgi:hypothetical protein
MITPFGMKAQTGELEEQGARSRPGGVIINVLDAGG